MSDLLKTDRKWEIILYPDSTSYDCNELLTRLINYFPEWAFILHDKDVNADGTPKKAHYHFYGRYDRNKTANSLVNELGLPGEHCLANIRSWRKAIRYLVHYDDPDKQSYDRSAICSNFSVDSFFQVDPTDDEMAQQIYSHIIELNARGMLTMPNMVDWAISNHLWSAFRRGFAVWQRLIKELTDIRRLF